MIRDVNDQPWRADLLGELLSGRRPRVHVNLIPLNPTPGLGMGRLAQAGGARVRPPAARPRGVPVTVRDTRGREIDGACGQLAASVD